MSSEDNTERFERWKQENISTPPSLSQASLLLSRLQQSLRLLSGDLNHDSLRKVLKGVGRETALLTQILTAKDLPLTSRLSAAVGKLVAELSGEGKSLDASTLRTLSHAIDCLRGFGTEKAISLQLQRLPMHVLVLDDDPVCRKIMEQALDAEFMSVVLCETAEEALNRLNASCFDVVLSDISMPEVDGFSFIQRLRQIKLHAQTPVVFVTGLDDLVTRSKSRLTGGCDLIAKPVKPAELTVKIIAFAWKNRLLHDPPTTEPTPKPLPSDRSRSGGEAPGKRPGQSQIGVVSVSPEGRIKSINRDAANLLGYSADELQNEEIARFLTEKVEVGEAKALTADRLAEHARRATSTLVRGLHKTGESYSMQLRVSRSGTGKTALFVCLLTANPEPSAPPRTS